MRPHVVNWPLKPAGTTIMEEFYKDHSNDPTLIAKSSSIHSWGGPTVVEALRLGRKVIGIDLNPIAWFIVKTQVSVSQTVEMHPNSNLSGNRHPFQSRGANSQKQEFCESKDSLTCIKHLRSGACDTLSMSESPLIDPASDKIVSLAEETKFAPNGIVSRTLLRTETTRVVLFGFAEGQELTEHTSTQQAVVQILSGECEFSLAGQAHPAKAGDLIYMPPNLRHAVKATKSFSMLLTLWHRFCRRR